MSMLEDLKKEVLTRLLDDKDFEGTVVIPTSQSQVVSAWAGSPLPTSNVEYTTESFTKRVKVYSIKQPAPPELLTLVATVDTEALNRIKQAMLNTLTSTIKDESYFPYRLGKVTFEVIPANPPSELRVFILIKVRVSTWEKLIV